MLKLCGAKYTVNYSVFYAFYLGNSIPMSTRSDLFRVYLESVEGWDEVHARIQGGYVKKGRYIDR